MEKLKFNQKIIAGTAQFNPGYGILGAKKGNHAEMVRNLLNECFKNGIKTLDTAPVYGDAEKLIGMYSKGRFEIITKLPSKPPKNISTTDWVRKEITSSEKRTKKKFLQFCYIIRSIIK